MSVTFTTDLRVKATWVSPAAGEVFGLKPMLDSVARNNYHY